MAFAIYIEKDPSACMKIAAKVLIDQKGGLTTHFRPNNIHAIVYYGEIPQQCTKYPSVIDNSLTNGTITSVTEESIPETISDLLNDHKHTIFIPVKVLREKSPVGGCILNLENKYAG